MPIQIQQAPNDFSKWPELLDLLHKAFAYQHARINPPSSLHALNAASLAAKAKSEVLFLALDQGQMVGCVFAKPRASSLYIGKFAVLPERAGQGIGRQLMAAVEALAHELNLETLELETRIELIENHATFTAMGFVKTAEQAHAGFDRPTSITMRKALRFLATNS